MRLSRTCAAAWLAGTLLAAVAQDIPPERHRLYTARDPACAGGLRGRVIAPAGPIRQILAMPPDEPHFVYEGTVSGADRAEFRFENLPMRRYDLLIVYADAFYEGLELMRGESTLTQADRESIRAVIEKSEPFFTDKVIHRLEGETGRGNTARAICTFARDKPVAEDVVPAAAPAGFDRRTTLKLVLLKDVGPGWQITRARDLYPVWATSASLFLKHHHAQRLSRFRVTDFMKEVGDLNLHE